MSRRKQSNPRLCLQDECPAPKNWPNPKAVSPGRGEEGDKQVATEADQNAQELQPTKDFDESEDEFQPLVIDTTDDKTKMSTHHKPSEKKETYSEQMALYRENNPSDVEEDNAPSPQRPQEVPVLSNTPNTPQGGFTSDTSTPSDSRVNSPALSTTSNSGGSMKSGKLSQPQKARRKTDKIMPVDESGQKYACPICQKILISNTELTKHIRSHNNGAPVTANSCTICGKVLSSQSSLDRHMLVHSGERPFKCKYCNMAFTTNGNMHRHTRIHEKEGTTGDSSSGRSTSGRQSQSMGDLDTPYSQVGFTSPVVKRMRELTPSGSKRKLAFEESYLSQLHAAKRSTFSRGSNLTREFMMMSPTEGRTVHATTPSPPKMKIDTHTKPEEDSGERNGDYICPYCPKQFVCRFAMETHLATHPDVSFSCHLCSTSFTNNQELNLHKMDVHNCTAPLSKHEVSDAGEEDPDLQSVGFQHLTFTDFTQDKFPLIAQAWCDKNNRQASSAFHDFTCKICNKAFPCQSALTIHKNTHAPENMNECKNCHACFSDGKALSDHMLNHTACKVVARVALSEGAQDKPQDIVSQEEFMASFGLKIQSKSPTSNDEAEKVPEEEKKPESRINTDYYPILKQMAELHQRSAFPYNNSLREFMQRPVGKGFETGNDLADIQQILSRFGPPPMDREYQSSSLRPPTLPSFYKPGFMMPGPMGDGSSMKGSDQESDVSMRLPVMVTNGFVPVQNKRDLDEGMTGAETYQCKYCPDVFNNYRAYKSHVRTHLGQSPYKCNLCPYTSADKSTLIRHFRIHNGERPYQCKICEFAFTTKANCERHIRKKHYWATKKDLDESIGYNHYATEGFAEESFGSPDTLCKYCGEDFKYFRDLKNHLRSHNSCAIKPFLCKICNNGFSTKANCMRHIQKQHTEVEDRLVEEHIYVNEQLAAVMAEDNEAMDRVQSPGPSQLHRPGLPSESPIVISPIPHYPTPMHLIPQPRPHTQSTFITSPPIIDLTSETSKPKTNSEEDQPLDFSMKATQEPMPPQANPITIEPHHMSGGRTFERSVSDEQPMDLTMKPTSSHHSAFSRPEQSIYQQAPNTKVALSLSDLSPDVASRALPQLLVSPTAPDYGMLRYKKEYQKFYNASVGRLQCPYCKMLFKHGLKLQVHIRSHTNERPFSCFYCSASFTIKTNLERHLKTRHPKKPAFIPDVGDSVSSEHDQEKEVPMEEDEAPSNATPAEMYPQAPRTNNFNGSDDSSCELSSVNKILDVTSASHFRGFLSAASEENTPEPQSKSSTPFTQYQDKDTESMLDEDSEAEGEVITLNPHVLDSETIIQHTADSLPIIKIRNPKIAERSDDPSSPNKKKRNSYADSPHKLMCPYCPRAFPWISSLNRHILTHTGQKPFKCPQCPVMFSTKSNRERHLVRKHGLNVLDPMTRQMMDRPYKCHLCVFSSFSTAGNLMKHYTEKHPEEPIPEYLNDEENTTPNDSYSTECEENSRYEANSAKRLDFGDDDEDSKGEIQDGLGQKLLDQVHPIIGKSYGDSRAATPNSHGAPSPDPTPPGTPDRQQINPEKDNYNADKITECWKCFEELGTRKNLLRHLKEHNIDLAFKCYLCDASYDNRLESLDHMGQRHPQDWTMLCEKNQVTDMNEFADCMNRIVEQNFIGNNNFGKKLTKAELEKYKVQLLEDMKPESDYVQRKVYCSLCPKRFWSLQDLRRHMRSHTGERPFECDICQKRFTLKHSMMRHRRRHTDTAQSPAGSDDDGPNNMETSLQGRLSMITAHKALSAGEMLAAAAAGVSTARTKCLSPSRPGVNGDLLGSLAGGLGSDLLHNLLGVDDTDIDEMITSGSADQAARVLGVKQ